MGAAPARRGETNGIAGTTGPAFAATRAAGDGAGRDPDRLPGTDRDERRATGGKEPGRGALPCPPPDPAPFGAVCPPAATATITCGHLSREALLAGGRGRVPVDREVGQQRDLLALVVDPAGDQQDLAVAPGAQRLLVQPREDDDLDRALQVLERHDRHRRLGLGDDGPDAGHDPADDDPLAVERLVAQVARVGRDEARRPARRPRPSGAPRGTARAAPSPSAAARGRAPRSRSGAAARAPSASAAPRSNSEVCPVIRSRCVACAGRDRVVEPEQDLGRVAERAQRPDLGQRLEHLAVREPQVDPRAEVGQRAELAALVARRDDRFDRALPDVLDRQQPEPDRVALDGELEMAAVDVRRQDLDRPSGGTRRRPPRPSPRSSGRRSGPRSCSRPCGSPSCTRSGRRSGRSRWRGPC